MLVMFVWKQQAIRLVEHYSFFRNFWRNGFMRPFNYEFLDIFGKFTSSSIQLQQRAIYESLRTLLFWNQSMRVSFHTLHGGQNMKRPLTVRSASVTCAPTHILGTVAREKKFALYYRCLIFIAAAADVLDAQRAIADVYSERTQNTHFAINTNQLEDHLRHRK